MAAVVFYCILVLATPIDFHWGWLLAAFASDLIIG